MRAHNPQPTLAAAALAATLLCAAAAAQPIARSARCGDLAAQALLEEEIALRAQKTEGWTLRWEETEGSCRLEARLGVLSLVLPLPSTSDEETLRAAAVRAAWFMTTHSPPPPSAPPSPQVVEAPQVAVEAPAPAPAVWNMDLRFHLDYLPAAAIKDASFLGISGWMRAHQQYAFGLGLTNLLTTQIARIRQDEPQEQIARLRLVALQAGMGWLPQLSPRWGLGLRGMLGLALIHYEALETEERSEEEDGARLEGVLHATLRHQWSPEVQVEGGVVWRSSWARWGEGAVPENEENPYGLGVTLGLTWTMF
jgi:hypothetical protein